MKSKSFGGRKQYFDDVEFSFDLSPDPFAEESYGLSPVHLNHPHKAGRSNKSQKNFKTRNPQNSEKNKENES